MISLVIWLVASLSALMSFVTWGGAHHPPLLEWWTAYLFVTGIGLYRLRWWGAWLLFPPTIFLAFIFMKGAGRLAMQTPFIALLQLLFAIMFTVPLIVVLRCRSALEMRP